MNTFLRRLRSCWEFFLPESYYDWQIRSVMKSYERKRTAARNSKNPEEIAEIEAEASVFCEEFAGPREMLRNSKLIAKARKMRIELFDISVPDGESHYWRDHWGNEMLRPEIEQHLRELMRKAEKDFQKERREIWDFRIRLVTTLLTAATGVIGTTVGLVAVLKK